MPPLPYENVNTIRMYRKDNFLFIDMNPVIQTTSIPTLPTFTTYLPSVPQTSVLIRPAIQFVPDTNERKFCTILVLFYFILLCTLFLTASLVVKFYIENNRFRLASVPTK